MPPWRCSSTGPPGCAPAPPTPADLDWSPTSSAASTGCRWPSSSPRAGCRRSRSPTCTAASTARSTCSAGGPAASAAPDPARHRRVVLPAARRRRAAAVPVPVRVRRRDRARRRRAARPRTGPGRRPRQVLSRLVDASMLEAEFADTEHGDRHPLPDAGDAAGVRARPARRRGRGPRRRRPPAGLGRRRSPRGSARRCCTEHEPEADAALRRELANLRAAWRWPAGRGSLDAAAAIVTALSTRSPTGICGGPGLGRGAPAAIRRSSATPSRSRAGHRGRPPTTVATTPRRPAHPGRARPSDRRRRRVGLRAAAGLGRTGPRGVRRGRRACLAAADTRPGWARPLPRRARRAYSGDPDRARDAERTRRGGYGVTHDARLERLRRRGDRERRRPPGGGAAALRRAIDLARSSGATFLVGSPRSGC